MHDKGKQKCDEIDFNERNQPVGPESVKLSTLEGILAREMVPITIERCPDIPEEVKDKLWACVKRRESRAPSSISRVDVWIKGHTRKEGKSMNEVLDATVGTNPSQRSSNLLQSTPHDNLSTSVNEVGSVTESIKAMKLSKRGGSSIANLPTGLDMDQSNGVSSLAYVKCKLLYWEGSNLVVAEGQIASRDPKSKVHHATLGALCWKVWVNHVTVNVPLFRSTREMYDLQDAIGSTVGWPSQFILLD
ncbi:uncharacterized protein LOC114271350 isoform X1 [Camellia sinensis]|uniref:uncharacterized protein LOC114271350 isoform X1 n=1 Tax=Camellia sinensis TaxID=4442 RepID=UPI001035A98C|nr:uncharacterized protein LOC114271350 isoform X1 [Camellia sinensis]